MPTDQPKIVNARDERLKAIATYVENMPYKPSNHWDMLTQMVKDLGEMRDSILKPLNEKAHRSAPAADVERKETHE